MRGFVRRLIREGGSRRAAARAARCCPTGPEPRPVWRARAQRPAGRGGRGPAGAGRRRRPPRLRVPAREPVGDAAPVGGAGRCRSMDRLAHALEEDLRERGAPEQPRPDSVTEEPSRDRGAAARPGAAAASGEVVELGAAGEAVSEDDRVRPGSTYGGQQVVLGDRHRDLVVPLLDPEVAGQPAAAAHPLDRWRPSAPAGRRRSPSRSPRGGGSAAAPRPRRRSGRAASTPAATRAARNSASERTAALTSATRGSSTSCAGVLADRGQAARLQADRPGSRCATYGAASRPPGRRCAGPRRAGRW